jgi:hypothetical protein
MTLKLLGTVWHWSYGALYEIEATGHCMTLKLWRRMTLNSWATAWHWSYSSMALKLWTTVWHWSYEWLYDIEAIIVWHWSFESYKPCDSAGCWLHSFLRGKPSLIPTHADPSLTHCHIPPHAQHLLSFRFAPTAHLQIAYLHILMCILFICIVSRAYCSLLSWFIQFYVHFVYLYKSHVPFVHLYRLLCAYYSFTLSHVHIVYLKCLVCILFICIILFTLSHVHIVYLKSLVCIMLVPSAYYIASCAHCW